MEKFSIFALGVMPYITASIIIQLLAMDIVPYLTELSKQGISGRNKMNQITRVVGIILAFKFKDNRAICPVTIFLNTASYYSYLRVKCDHDKCINCKKCVNICPMNVNMLDDSRKRNNATECILCCNCIKQYLKKHCI